ncbi:MULTISPECIES: SDR family oxidoreductase [unclassified Sulfitobacter]|jgi:NAD(P)-dependent dehydrogenase (short-subunit alcohol dehydrogenase family)|uniref:SDR family oxidoreductase n=1 Tax=unclassified Sulfitobacter TaxID=196795 RepID=UPI0007C2BD08|nr:MULTISPECIES: SDR family oxidoreductase [unclassified Sulfitobacter]KZX99154.1 NAD(P)-dependent oxidoreductase [Sulfitobacter sp. HI0023]KZY22357.1 NAD(P)-dependent oxidoreductase [Sulfitobacter sp. HI0040]KZZ65515.1 NAD(P)-dependent oxidoreductase [Sulfitobacter sp. HI0129]
MSQDFTPMDSPQRQPGLEHEMDPAPQYMPRYPGSDRLKGKVALITGGDSGIGRATAVLYAREGAKVAIVYRDEDKDARKTADLIEDEGSQSLLIKGDVGDKSFCEDAVRQTMDKFGQLDILVNDAGEQHAQENVEDIEEAQIERTFRTNIFGMMFMTQAALPHLKKGARIICVTSVTAYKGQDLLVDYASTKGAILAFLRAMSGKLAPEGILVNGVAPGPIWTPLIPASFPEEAVEDFGKNAPLGRPGQPNEVAPSLLFLACDDSSYMTGQVLHPNGGTLVGG